MIKRHFWPALSFKLTSGILLGILFHHHYGVGDTLRYYQEASQLANLTLSEFLENVSESIVASESVRAIYFVRLIAVIKFVTHADYWLLSVYFSLFSFAGSFYLVDNLVRCNENWKSPAVLSFLYFPSVVFWSSGLLKESLVFGALTFLTGLYISWFFNRKLKLAHVLIGAVSLLIIIAFKYYIAAVLVPIIVYLVASHLSIWERWRIIGLWKRTILITLVGVIPFLIFLNGLSPNLGYEKLWLVMQENHNIYLQLTPDRVIHTLSWFDNGLDVVINIPYLWFSGIFRPLIGEDLSFPAILSSLENTLLLIGSLLGFFLWIKSKPKWTPEVLAIIVYVSVLSIFLSYSTPNFGTLARFKIYYVPLLLMLIVTQVHSLYIFRKN